MKAVGWASGVCVGDYNNDGFEDLFCTYFGQNSLYRNNGDGTFTDVTKAAGLLTTETRWGAGCSFVDYNRDGHLDLFVSNYVDFSTSPTRRCRARTRTATGRAFRSSAGRAGCRRHALALSQQRRRDVHRCQPRGGHRQATRTLRHDGRRRRLR